MQSTRTPNIDPKANYTKVGTTDLGDNSIEVEIVTTIPTDETKDDNLMPTPSFGSILWKSIQTQSFFNEPNNEYENHFMDFDQLRDILHNVSDNKPDARKRFFECLDGEWNLYQRFAEKEAMRINQYPVEKYVMAHILKYNQFVCITQRSLNEIIRQYDSMSLDDSLAGIWEWKINWNPQKMLFGLIKKISNLYDKQRKSNDLYDNESNQSINEFSFDRESTKYFVKRSNIMQVIGVIIQHLPIYVFGENDKDKISPRVSGYISSVYFDNDEFKCYDERVGKEEGARVFRIRWYGQKEPINQSDTVFLERKIHHITSMGCGPSMKERFKMKSGKIRGFLNGSLKVPSDTPTNKTNLQNEIYEFVEQYGFRPKTRTVCDRMSFQASKSNDLRISLDLNLRFFKERNDLFKTQNLWFTPMNQFNEKDLAIFPFDVLEIKLAGQYTNNPPQWITDLMDSHLLIDCYKFSKYGQSVNEFYQNKIELIPNWIQNIDVLNKNYSTLKSHSSATILRVGAYDVDKNDQKNEKKKSYKYWKPVCFCSKDQQNRKAKPVNPKVHFSNERTFLQWFKAAIFIGSAGISTHTLAPHDSAGYIMVGCALLILVWGLVVYYVRNWKLLTGTMEGLHDFWGPGFLGLVLIFVFLYAVFDPTMAAGIH